MPATARLHSLWNAVRSGLRPPHRHVAHFEQVLGTTLEVQVLADRIEQAGRAETVLLAEIDRLELIFSRFLPHSELNRWLCSRDAVPVSPELGTVLQQAQMWMQLSGGAFHPVTEALTPLWKAAELTGQLPDVQAVLGEMDWPLYHVWQTGEQWTALRLSTLPTGFNAFAKGFIADRAAAAALLVPGVQQVVVNLGGDLRVLGPQLVRVEIADPFTRADNAPPLCSVQVRGQGVATSGRARRGFLVAGQWYSHLIDPRSGQPAGQVVSASVVAQDSASADVLATIFSILDPPDSLRLADTLPGVACLLIIPGGQLHHNAAWTSVQIGPLPSRLPVHSEVEYDQAVR